MKKLSSLIVILSLMALAGCATQTSTTIKTPLTARPVDREALIPHNGAIFQAGKNDHPLFEDHRARNVGDTLTISIAESTSANQSTTSSASHAGSMSASTPTITKGASTAGGAAAPTILAPFSISDSSSGSLSNKSADTGTNAFTGTITVTVVEVLPNGNLLVGGEKLMAINQDKEYIRISGVIDPVTISGNTVLSTQVSDVHLEYKGADGVEQSQILGMLGRAFLSMLPF